jgi:hypothetical protein
MCMGPERDRGQDPISVNLTNRRCAGMDLDYHVNAYVQVHVKVQAFALAAVYLDAYRPRLQSKRQAGIGRFH